MFWVCKYYNLTEHEVLVKYLELEVRTWGAPQFHLHCSRCTNRFDISLLMIEILNLSCLMVVPSAWTLQTHQLSHPRECYHHFIHLEKIEFQSHKNISNKRYLIHSWHMLRQWTLWDMLCFGRIASACVGFSQWDTYNCN